MPQHPRGAAASPNEPYSRTRQFYLALGFRVIEELPELWGPQNPCVVLVKALPAR